MEKNTWYTVSYIVRGYEYLDLILFFDTIFDSLNTLKVHRSTDSTTYDFLVM